VIFVDSLVCENTFFGLRDGEEIKLTLKGTEVVNLEKLRSSEKIEFFDYIEDYEKAH